MDGLEQKGLRGKDQAGGADSSSSIAYFACPAMKHQLHQLDVENTDHQEIV